jgi:S-DNA-T family DNA segregation ATPase FtsK/SpoIIIE
MSIAVLLLLCNWRFKFILIVATRRRKPVPGEPSYFDDISPHTKQAIGAIFFVVLAIFFVFSSLGYAGIAGDATHKTLTYLFGYGFILAPIACGLFVFVFLKPRDDEKVSVSKLIGVALFFLVSLGILDLLVAEGGAVGTIVLYPFLTLFGDIVAGIMLFAGLLIGLFLTFNTNFVSLLKKKNTEEGAEDLMPDITPLPLPVPEAEIGEQTNPEEEKPKKKSLKDKILQKATGDFTVSSFRGTYAPPPLSLLHKDRGTPDVGDIRANSITIKRTLKKFNIDVELDAVTIGSSVTRYAIKPAEGVKLEKIVGLQTNLEYALAASPIRIEAPIPGKSLVGIEVPNRQKQMIGLASLFSSPEYTDSPKPLLVALGKNITGEAQFADVARMPHGLIAGTTGSGKSVAIHNVVISLLFRNSPDQLRFIMVDPKRIELTLYNGIPHLLTPVITDAKKVIVALRWTIKEMDRRLDLLGATKVQNINAYHESVYHPAKQKFEEKGSPEEERDDLPEPLPYIVVIIDELADLMTAYPKELEACIVRLAQMSRAVGIHLILSTQRPSVNVITGLIKANVPTRIALQVASQIDSRTILDQSGAEKLLGRGDMLFLSAERPKPTRLQSAFVTTDEVKKVVNYLKDQDSIQELDTINLEPQGDRADGSIFASSFNDGDEDDELYEEARQIALEAGKISTSFLQRRLRLGYARAARLIDMLEDRGVVGPADGSRPRVVLARGQESGDEEV